MKGDGTHAFSCAVLPLKSGLGEHYFFRKWSTRIEKECRADVSACQERMKGEDWAASDGCTPGGGRRESDPSCPLWVQRLSPPTRLSMPHLVNQAPPVSFPTLVSPQSPSVKIEFNQTSLLIEMGWLQLLKRQRRLGLVRSDCVVF